MSSSLSPKKVFLSLFASLLMGVGIWGVAGCGGGTGELSVSLAASNAPSTVSALTTSSSIESPGDVETVFVTINEVQVHLSGNDETEEDEGGGWITVATPMATFNLLDLQNCLLEHLGSAELPAGSFVTQIRLILGTEAQEGHPFANYIVVNGETSESLEIEVPSGEETGIKINPQGPVEIEENGEVHVTLVINLAHSLVFTGNGKILFKPVVIATVGGETADAFISGQVTNEADGSAIVGANVSAQTSDGEVENTATTDAEGNYRMCVAPGTYDVVVTAEGFSEEMTSVTVSGGETADVDFSLTSL